MIILSALHREHGSKSAEAVRAEIKNEAQKGRMKNAKVR
jgi:hypothetical protein